MLTHTYRLRECGHYIRADLADQIECCPFCEDYADAFVRSREFDAEALLDDVFCSDNADVD